jgi:hypothetical protein
VRKLLVSWYPAGAAGGKREPVEDRGAVGRLVDMFANSTTHRELSRLRQAELEAQARHADLIRRARAGQLQPELRQGRRFDQRARLAMLMRGRPAPT